MAIPVEVVSRNMEISERLQDYIDKKVAKLDRYLPGIEEARVDVTYEKSARNAADRQIAQITIRGKGFILRSEERADDIFAALDTALDKIQRRIERFKGKRYRGRGDGKSVAEAIVSETEGESVEEQPVIAKRKRFLVTPMDELEAIEQMNLLGHDSFFVFYNTNSGAINILYKRRNGTYGIIEPEVR
ncbi:MAG: ribosome-associated translation inhibitor RaiA [Anaerolineales bacterium]|nr:ribosome-associated translation inhibitor RaiA [Anaerolineales bacterium]MDW8447372.1 ribosome-associated translation inhibitor RaiA [Anaerolineales bacterium]